MLSTPKEMLMIRVDAAPLVQTIYIHIPENLIPNYPGFEPAKESEIPEEANLLFGYDDEFRRIRSRR